MPALCRAGSRTRICSGAPASLAGRDRGVLGIFGGTFDPVHFGHITLVSALLQKFDFEEIRFLPCREPPHKQATHAGAQHRLHMLNLIAGSTPGLVVDDRELRRPGPSYTVDTLREIRGEAGTDCALVLILGLDAFLQFCTWHEYDQILSICHIMLLRRPGYALEDTGCERELLSQHGTNEISVLHQAPCGNIFFSAEKEIEISSAAIRQCIAGGGQPRYLLPGTVWNYIRSHGLYRQATVA